MNRYAYLLILPGLIYIVIFSYVPIYGLLLSFKTYNFSKGIWGSPWVGLKNFEYLFRDKNFWIAFNNTLIISFGKIFLSLPFPILLAILLSEVRFTGYKRVIQSILYLPHFLSWVIVAGIIFNLLSVTDGTLSKTISAYTNQSPPVILANAKYFRTLVFSSHIWKTAGWGTVIYMAAIVGIDPTLYEAAIIDGANRFQRIWHITLPSLIFTVIILTILNIGSVMNAGFDQIFNLYDPSVYKVGDIIDTFVYRVGLLSTSKMEYGVTVGLFKSIINCALLLTANQIAKWIGYDGIL